MHSTFPQWVTRGLALKKFLDDVSLSKRRPILLAKLPFNCVTDTSEPTFRIPAITDSFTTIRTIGNYPQINCAQRHQLPHHLVSGFISSNLKWMENSVDPTNKFSSGYQVVRRQVTFGAEAFGMDDDECCAKELSSFSLERVSTSNGSEANSRLCGSHSEWFRSAKPSTFSPWITTIPVSGTKGPSP